MQSSQILKNEPLAKRAFGQLKNGNPSGDFTTAPRCKAKTRAGGICQSPGMKNGRCRLHGGKSTGPLTVVGKSVASRNSLKTGDFDAAARERWSKIVQYGKTCREYREALAAFFVAVRKLEALTSDRLRTDQMPL
ncbi:MAG: HGGxSTG domain-containing protein [Bdellovibrionota bacterium]